jgi:two-component system, OmpR family, response regulator ChvI
MSSKGTILIVDDEIDITLAFKKGLESNGFMVDIYNDPVTALLNFKSDFYDLILVDVRMPKMNGFELYQEIEKVDKKSKVCFITAFEVYYHALREIFPTLEVGCFIRKPIEIDDLVKRINSEIHSQDIDK